MPPTSTTEYTATRDALHLVAVHVLARRRFAVKGRFGLRPTPGGFGTPAFGDPDHEEVLRVSGATLIREQRRDGGMRTSVHPIDGATLRDLAASAGTDLGTPLSVGTDTPAFVDPDVALRVTPDAAASVAEWFHLGARALDQVLARRAAGAAPSVAQIWPEHFDLGIDVAVGASRANLGASPGDRHHDGPYVYVGPWTADRPGDPAFWNAPFGALLGRAHIADATDPARVLVATTTFLDHGLELLGG